ncbi:MULTISPECIES: hypothetical protein [Mesorhizobium]|jgi:purine nucleoside permease|uniref:Uncharacterized protein n=1 Tax=Rhizobium loti TaxID=381 RepID=A0A6M7U5L7_RHILI|nr:MULTISPECIES: hypothetical protein [Mesorhizobium]KRB22430.1 hypothetical protein ASE05_14495 [Mesorhizobium sp. Root172]OBQ62299.1 hypothetical protein A8145_21925 [Mesorhizobium loti]QKC71373.1 hypothetical protein EB815_21245 [Mesorhizobium loti]QKC90290.1 hypothetical protein EB230_19220 [Mesorhizobium sp. NZP2234]TPM96335.1 hypothetical protein FJ977_17090 [Mesorhizobium sp. B2-1-3A]
MRLILRSSIALLLAGFAAGCTSDDYVRSEGLTTGAGNAQAANTVMQMVDPWKYGVQNTRLLVPAKRGDAGPVTPDQAAASKASQTTTGN